MVFMSSFRLGRLSLRFKHPKFSGLWADAYYIFFSIALEFVFCLYKQILQFYFFNFFKLPINGCYKTMSHFCGPGDRQLSAILLAVEQAASNVLLPIVALCKSSLRSLS